MPRQRVVLLLGSERDLEFASTIARALDEYGVDHELRVASAHRAPRRLLEILEEYEESGEALVYITVAGLSDALSGLVAGSTRYPVIACPPDAEDRGWPKAFSSAMTPRGVAVSLVLQPENAALAAAKILALSNPSLLKRIQGGIEARKREVAEADERLRRGKGR